MGKVLLIIFGISLAYLSCYIFFGGKKKNKKEKKKEKKAETESKEKKIEQAIKSNRPNAPKEEVKEEEKKVQPQEQEAQKGFRIIRKKSQVKINKKALHSGSRNPSVTRVFDKNGKKIGEEVKEEKKQKEIDFEQTFKKLEQEEVGRFGARQIDYNVVNDGANFRINNPEGTNNRAPIITDRTNFKSHLNETNVNNPYSISGIGVKQAIDKAEMQAATVDDDTEEMVRNIKRNFLGVEEDVDPFETIRRRMERQKESENKTDNNENPLKKIDAKTLILADAISNPKYKKNIKKD